jgi:hypothetical protein
MICQRFDDPDASKATSDGQASSPDAAGIQLYNGVARTQQARRRH